MRSYINKLLHRSCKEWGQRVERGLKIYLRWCLIPCLALMFSYIVYHYAVSPEQFYYQYYECQGTPYNGEEFVGLIPYDVARTGCPPPAKGHGLRFYWWKLTPDFDIPIVSREEYDERQARDQWIAINTELALLLGVVGLYFKFKEKGVMTKC